MKNRLRYLASLIVARHKYIYMVSSRFCQMFGVERRGMFYGIISYMCVCVCVYIYIYIYTQRKRNDEFEILQFFLRLH